MPALSRAAPKTRARGRLGAWGLVPVVDEADGQERGDILYATTSERRHGTKSKTKAAHCACSLTGWLYVGRFHQVPVDHVASAENDADIPLTRMLLYALGIAGSVIERTDEERLDPSCTRSRDEVKSDTSSPRAG